MRATSVSEGPLAAIEVEAAIEQLKATQSAQRRKAAKALRQAGDPRAQDALLAALETEIQDPRTWETQYQIIMALGTSGARSALPLLHEILTMPLEPMVHLSAGDALVRLSDDPDAALVAAIQSRSLFRIEGAIRAAAMMHPTLSTPTVDIVITFASQPEHAQVRFWVAAGAAGWRGGAVETFLKACVRDGDAETQRAARAALEGRYLKWNPL